MAMTLDEAIEEFFLARMPRKHSPPHPGGLPPGSGRHRGPPGGPGGTTPGCAHGGPPRHPHPTAGVRPHLPPVTGDGGPHLVHLEPAVLLPGGGTGGGRQPHGRRRQAPHPPEPAQGHHRRRQRAAPAAGRRHRPARGPGPLAGAGSGPDRGAADVRTAPGRAAEPHAPVGGRAGRRPGDRGSGAKETRNERCPWSPRWKRSWPTISRAGSGASPAGCRPPRPSSSTITARLCAGVACSTWWSSCTARPASGPGYRGGPWCTPYATPSPPAWPATGPAAPSSSALLGHESLATTQRYVDASAREVRAAARANETYAALRDLAAEAGRH